MLQRRIADSIAYLTSAKVFYSIVLIYFLVNLLYVFFSKLSFTSDSLYYFQKAIECVENGTLYPASHNLYDQYIQSPLYINFLIIILNLYKSQTTVLIANTVLNLVQLLLVFKIGKQLFNDDRSARIISLLYIIYLTNLGAVLLNLSEFLFTTLILLSFHLFYKNKISSLLLSGIVIGAAYGIKQIAAAVLISFLLTHFYLIRKQSVKYDFIYLLIGFGIAVTLMGFITYESYGKFIVTPETASVNLLIGANENANGSFNDDVFEEGKAGYLENESELTHSRKTNFYREQALEWIKENPLEWISLFPLKLFHLYAFDDWSIFTLVQTIEWNLSKIGSMLLKGQSGKIFEGESFLFIGSFVILYLFHYGFYYILIFLFVRQLLVLLKGKKSKLIMKFLPIYLFTLLGSAAILIGVGAARYKYPFIILLLITTAPLINNYLQNYSRLYSHSE